jgi:hypothetical protein
MVEPCSLFMLKLPAAAVEQQWCNNVLLHQWWCNPFSSAVTASRL